MTRILILGGAGVFGSRLARMLDRDARFDLVIAGRNEARAQEFAATLTGPARKEGVGASVDSIADTLRQMAPDLVIHCAGPFQGHDYTVAEAAIAVGIDYADLSDGRAFAEGFPILDAAAKKAGVFALTACSTTSALSTAAALRLAEGLSRIDAVRVGVTPGNRAPRGPAVVEAILSYVGEPIPVRKDGETVMATGWGSLARESLPGLGARYFSPCDAPDMPAMNRLFPQARRIDFLAGLELPILHLPLWTLAKLRRARMIPNLAGAAGFFHAAASRFEAFGGDKGGMFVELAGTDGTGAPVRRRWRLVAGSGDGPNIPAIAAAILAKRCASGDRPAPGARITMGDIALDAFEQEFAAFDITTAMETSDGADAVSRPVWRAL